MTENASDSLFVLHDDAARVTEVRSQLYDSEEALRLLPASHPELLTAHTSGASTPRRWILVSREQGIPDAPGAGNRWALEHFKSKGLTFLSENVQGYPPIPVVSLGDESSWKRFRDAATWLFTRVRETSQGTDGHG